MNFSTPKNVSFTKVVLMRLLVTTYIISSFVAVALFIYDLDAISTMTESQRLDHANMSIVLFIFWVATSIFAVFRAMDYYTLYMKSEVDKEWLLYVQEN